MRSKLISAISAIAIIEFVLGSVLIEGGSFGLGVLAMLMPVAWFGLLIVRYGRN